MQSSGFRTFDGHSVYTISGIETMPEFFMSLVSSGNHWMFISSNGALTTGRETAEQALFPYETVDKIMAGRGQTGTRTLIRFVDQSQPDLWEPFGTWTHYVCPVKRSVSKDCLGSMVIFEEQHARTGLIFRWSWSFSNQFGFVRKAWLENTGSVKLSLELADGLLNVMSSGITRRLQSQLSCLSDAYKDNCLDPPSGLAAFGLASIITDRAEPREALQASLVWQSGLPQARISLTRDSLDTLLSGQDQIFPRRVTGRKGDFLAHSRLELAPGESHGWYIIADTGCDNCQAEALRQRLSNDRAALLAELEHDIAQVRTDLWRFVARADGQSLSANRMHQWHHSANTLFNIMRGGIPENGMMLRLDDFLSFLAVRNKAAYASFLPVAAGQKTAAISMQAYGKMLAGMDDIDLRRLGRDYLPLTFSRRHGDPSRPWNEFAIRVRDESGKPRLDYQGNWRDIFQNWEGLALSHPAYLDAFIGNFLDAITLDGYNPYRVSRDGIDWELVEPDNPWSNIGYWNDHQIIYLQKLLEAAQNIWPGRLSQSLSESTYSWAAVPYRIASYGAICENPRSTISFDARLDAEIRSRVRRMGTDGRLCLNPGGEVRYSSLLEKLLVLASAKIGNLVPGGGIWMNTQRPEWNDANNALAGYGLSMVSVMYLRRFVNFWSKQIQLPTAACKVAGPLARLIQTQLKVLAASRAADGFRDVTTLPAARKRFMDGMGTALEAYRNEVYKTNDEPAPQELSAVQLMDWLHLVLECLDASIQQAKRADGLYEAYSRLDFNADFSEAYVASLYPMLEGQVAALSAGFLSPEEGLELLATLRRSSLYCPSRKSYLLYPDRTLPDFFAKNIPARVQLDALPLAAELIKRGSRQILAKDVSGQWRFGPAIQNAAELDHQLDSLVARERMANPAGVQDLESLVASGRPTLHKAYEALFNHASFTGRSGAMYAYEGLGSIYWHMVAKLMVCVQELRQLAWQGQADVLVLNRLDAAYLDIREGIGYRKSPAEWGAFPFDPYSHTPKHAGAQQPGMTGQVKEELLTRLAELGVYFNDACIHVMPTACLTGEFLKEAAVFRYVTQAGLDRELTVKAGELAFTICRVPCIRQEASGNIKIEVVYRDGSARQFGSTIDPASSAEIFDYSDQVEVVRITGGILPPPLPGA